LVTNPGPPVPDGDYFVLTYRRDATAAAGAFVEHSATAAEPWTPATNGIDGVVATTTPDGFAPGIDRVAVHIPRQDSRLFVRVGASIL
jgi:hypothetical protein